MVYRIRGNRLIWSYPCGIFLLQLFPFPAGRMDIPLDSPLHIYRFKPGSNANILLIAGMQRSRLLWVLSIHPTIRLWGGHMGDDSAWGRVMGFTYRRGLDTCLELYLYLDISAQAAVILHSSSWRQKGKLVEGNMAYSMENRH